MEYRQKTITKFDIATPSGKLCSDCNRLYVGNTYSRITDRRDENNKNYITNPTCVTNPKGKCVKLYLQHVLSPLLIDRHSIAVPNKIQKIYIL